MKKISLIAALLVLSLLSDAQSLISLSAEDKLSNNTVSSMCEDKLGRIWIATKSGVDIFDGYDVGVLYHDPLDENSIQSNLINKVYRDLDDNIWICNSSGLALYDCSINQIRRIKISLKSVENLVQVSPRHYLMCSQSESVLYDSESGACRSFAPDGIPFVFYNAERWNDCFLFCTSSHNLEFIMFDENGDWSRKAAPLHFPHALHGIIFDPQGNIFTDASGAGLWKIDPVTMETTLVNVENLPVERIECICSDKQGDIWLGTKGGLCIYDHGVSVKASAVLPGLLPHESLEIRTFFKDSKSNIWIGTSFDGAICVLGTRRQFETAVFTGPEAASNTVRSFGPSPDGTCLWIGTQYGGIYRMQANSRALEQVSDIPMACSICFLPEYPSRAFVSSFVDGIYSLDCRSGKSRLIYKKPDISLIHPANEGKIWAGSFSGLYLIDPVLGTAENPGLFSDNTRQSVTSLMTDSDSCLWVGCREGLYRCKVGPGNILKDASFPGMSDIMRVNSLLQTSDGSIWIGTSDGLISFSGGQLKGYVVESSLRGRAISGMREGDASNLWITTDRGLVCYNYKSGKCSAFYVSNGLINDNFITGQMTSFNGDFYVGGRGGVSFYNPVLMSEDTVTVAPFISQLLVHNHVVRPSDGSKILNTSIENASDVVIRHNQNAFSFHFTCPDFSAEENNIFWYMMEGFDKDWIRSSDRIATYTNLPKGKYVFRVRAANTSGVLCPKEVALNVRVWPAWYQTDAFFIFIALLLVSGVFYLLIYALRKADEKNERKMLAMKDKYEEELRRSKIRLFLKPDYVPTPEEEKMFLKFIGKVEESISNPELSVESLASYMCMSRCNLHLKIKSITGNSPIDLIKKIRIEKACEILRQGKLPLAEVAEQSGFASASYFCFAFKKATGYTPKEYVSGR